MSCYIECDFCESEAVEKYTDQQGCSHYLCKEHYDSRDDLNEGSD